MNDFFISYNKADKGWAEWIAWQLEEAGYSTLIQTWDFRPGRNFAVEMRDGLAQAKRVVAVLSPDYLKSEYTTAEWIDAFAQDPASKKGMVLPVLVRECELPPLLRSIIYVRLVGLDNSAEAKRVLLEGASLERLKPAVEPGFPGSKPTPAPAISSSPPFPGAAASAAPLAPKLPPVWNVPHNRNPNFTGRQELLESLHAALSSGEFSALTQAIHGLGGVGKTQTAVEYAFRYASDYDAVLWVAAEDPAVLADNFAALGREIGLNADAADQPKAIAEVKRWLRENRRWLLIFDNAEKVADIKSLLPPAGSGHVIITSRNPDWRAVAKPLAVLAFTTEEAVRFLLARTGQDDEESAAAFAKEVDGLALVLEQAAAYVEENGISFAEYLRLFREHGEEVLSRETSPDYPWTVETVWEISLAQVRRSSPAAAELLNLLAFFAPDDIPLDLIRAGRKVFPDMLANTAGQEPRLREVIGALRRHSLVEVKDDSVSIHRMVQAATRRSLSIEERKCWAEAAILTIRNGLPGDPDDIATWPVFARLASHASASAEHCEMEDVALEWAGFCLNQAGSYHIERGDDATARIFLTRALRITEVACGPDHPNVAIRVNNLGMIQEAEGDLAGARVSLERALRIDEAAYGPDHPIVATRVNNLGIVQRAEGDIAGARVSLERALRIDEAACGPDHPNVARDVSNLGIVQRAEGDLAGARASYERALRIDEAAYGPDHPRVAIRVNNLGSVQKAKGDLAGARASYERALRIDEAAFGPDHPNVARDVNNLGGLQQDQGDLAGARASYERALQIFRKFLGDDHPNTRIVRGNLEVVLEALGEDQPT